MVLKQKADDEWRARVLAMQAEAEMPVRKPKKANDHASQIECIEFGGWEIDTWYAAPYPAEYSRNRVLYICEFCLKYMNSDYVAWRHKLKCPLKHPPGDEIYRHGSISFFVRLLQSSLETFLPLHQSNSTAIPRDPRFRCMTDPIGDLGSPLEASRTQEQNPAKQDARPSTQTF